MLSIVKNATALESPLQARYDIRVQKMICGLHNSKIAIAIAYSS